MNREAVIVDQLDERERQIKFRDANYRSNGALAAFLRKQAKEKEEKKQQLRDKWNYKKDAIRFRLGLKT